MAIADVGVGIRTVNHWIGGRSVASASGRSGVVWNPATGEAQAKVDFASVDEVDRAVAMRPTRAFAEWRATPLSRRSEVMFKLRELLDANRRRIAEMITSEHGKTLPDAMGEVARGLENVEFACGIPHLLKGGFSEQASRGIDVYQIRQPLGVVAGITPFNFPAMVPMWMFATAIACGNTFILKPSEKDPSVSLFVAELLKQAGVPDGVFNVVQGDKVAVDRLLEHPDVKAISFVGSTPVARSIYETATRNGKRVQALGGAKNHMLVLPDADVPMAADAAISAAYGSAGERCMAISVVVAVGSVADPLVSAIRERIAAIKIGPGLRSGQRNGPADHAGTSRSRGILRRQRSFRRRYRGCRRPTGRGFRASRLFPGTIPAGSALSPACAVTAMRSSDRCWASFAWTLTTRRSGSSMRILTATASRSSHATAAPRASSNSMSKRAWSASTCRSPYRWPTIVLADGKPRCSAICTSTDRRECSSIHGPKWSPAAGRIRGRSRVDLGFPQVR